MAPHKLGALIGAQRLAKAMTILSPKRLRVVDNSSIESYEDGHIPGAVFFDKEECLDAQSPYSGMLPSPALFEDYVSELGIHNDTHVVVYDDHEHCAMYSAPRLWWAFRAFGHDNVSVLSGGFRLWRDANQGITYDQVSMQAQKFTARYRPQLVKHFEDIESNIKDKKYQLVDARSAGRFHGTEPEPGEEVKPGHITGSVNLPFTSMMDPYTGPSGDKDHGCMKQIKDMRSVFADAKIDLDKPLVATCGTGVTACTLALAAFLCGKKDVPVYDGSWMEWYLRSHPSQRRDCPEE